ncbi:MAG TPA: MFS transporter, partial [Stellaceae bacterium]|nr:MFS transporter [Stellaceae bacterium]
VGMVLAGRLTRRMDGRILIIIGLLLTAYSLWQMASEFSMEMGEWIIIEIGLIQGFGLGLIFPPLSAIAFTTLAPELRTDAAGLYNLARNVGSSLGISVTSSVFIRTAQLVHSTLVEHVTPFNPHLRASPFWHLDTSAGLAALNGEITRQAAMVAYLDDFKLMMFVTLASVPLLALVRRPRQAAAIVSQPAQQELVEH